MNFKEALIAYLQGEKVESRHKAKQAWDWAPFGENFKQTPLVNMTNDNFDLHHEFRIAPRTITVNGVEVPAPESVDPNDGRLYFIAAPHVDLWAFTSTWSNGRADKDWLERGLVYLNKEDAISRAKAMLLHE